MANSPGRGWDSLRVPYSTPNSFTTRGGQITPTRQPRIPYNSQQLRYSPNYIVARPYIAPMDLNTQRNAEICAYQNFVAIAGNFNDVLPPQLRTPALSAALHNLLEAGSTYRQAVVVANANPHMGPQGFSHAVHQGQVLMDPTASFYHDTPAASIQGSPALQPSLADSPQFDQNPTPQQESNSAAAMRAVAQSLRQTLTQLQITQPGTATNNMPRTPLDETLKQLKDNINSYSNFLLHFLNGRRRHIAPQIRTQVKAHLDYLFDDDQDARIVVDQIMRAFRETTKYTESDVANLGADIVRPLGEVLWDIVLFLERQEDV